MKFIKTLLTSGVILGSICSSVAFAETATTTATPVVQTQPAVTATAPVATTPATTATTQTQSDKLNINTATATEIQKALVGIGAKKAQAVVEYREKHGNFTSAEQLLEVQGIGKATLEKNRDRILF